MTLEERFDEWAKAYEQKGKKKGESLVLQRQLVKRFELLLHALLTRIAAPDREQLEIWCNRVQNVTTLDDLFRLKIIWAS